MGQFQNQAEAEAAGIFISKVKSYVKREGRLTKGQARAIEQYGPDMLLPFQPRLLDLDSLYATPAPLVVEIGFGMGQSLVAMAQAAPEFNFLGIEVHRPGVGACLAAAGELGLTNLKVIEHDAVEVLRQMIPDNSLARLQLYFPDPWHKTRHHKRRIVQTEWVNAVWTKLSVGGHLHMATDWQPYAEHMTEVMTQCQGWQNLAVDGDYVPRPDYRPITKFEQRGHRLGHGVWDLVYEKVDV